MPRTLCPSQKISLESEIVRGLVEDEDNFCHHGPDVAWGGPSSSAANGAPSDVFAAVHGFPGTKSNFHCAVINLSVRSHSFHTYILRFTPFTQGDLVIR